LGYVFSGWDRVFVGVIEDITVVAQYVPGGSSGGSSPSSPSPSVPTPSPSPVSPSPSVGPEPSVVVPEPLPVWALMNLVLSVAGVILAAIVMVYVLLRKKKTQKQTSERKDAPYVVAYNREKSEDKKQKQHMNIWLVTTLVMAIAGVVVFLLTEDMSRTLAMVDNWTIVHVAIFIVEIIAIVFTFKRKDAKGGDQEKHISSDSTTTNLSRAILLEMFNPLIISDRGRNSAIKGSV
jgi:preprotein translocase subunit SecG